MPTKNPTPAPSTQKPLATGSCLCKSIQYTLTAPPIYSAICHCPNCRKTSGSAFATNCRFPKPGLHVHPFAPSSSTTDTTPTTTTTNNDKNTTDNANNDNGNIHLRTYEDSDTVSGATFSRQFCGRCGSSLFASSDREPDVVLVATGSLDRGDRGWGSAAGFADETLRPRVEFFRGEKRGWMEEWRREGQGEGEGDGEGG